MENGSAYAREGSLDGAFWPQVQETADVVGKRRGPLVGLVLTLAALGVYHFYFHLTAHGELLQQLDRRNREAPLVFAYLGLVVYGVTLGWALFFVPLLAAGGLFAYLVLQQFAVLEEARERQGLPMTGATGGPAKFFLWLIPGILIVVGPYVAYKRLIEEYNEVWGTFETETPAGAWSHLGRSPEVAQPTQAPSPRPVPPAQEASSHDNVDSLTDMVRPGTNGHRQKSPTAKRKRPRGAFSVKDR